MWEKKRFKCEKDYSWNPSTYICENNKDLKSPADTAVAECDKIVVAINNLSRKKTITIARIIKRIITSSISINFHGKKAGDCYILHTVLLIIILLWIITVICYHYAKQNGIIWNGK